MEKKPFVTLEQVKEMTASYPTPFHLYDEKGTARARKLKTRLPGIQTFMNILL